LKKLGNIFLVWRRGKGDSRIIIGKIKKTATTTPSFIYNQTGLKEAKEFGFKNFEGFPDTTPDKIYNTNVIEIFGQRIMRSERNDVDDFFKFWKIEKTYKSDMYYMLSYTQGLVPTDSFEFLTQFNPIDNLNFISEITGLSSANLDSSVLNKGDELRYELDSRNQYDKYAVKLFKEKTYLGHVKIIHNRVFHNSKRPLTVYVHHIEKNGTLKRVFIDISI
jgi:hypothetical protein